MDKRKIRDLFGAINVWKRGDQRAPHKPLLILLALARIARRYHGKPVRPPVNPEYVANSTYIAWHNREVFKGPQRSR